MDAKTFGELARALRSIEIRVDAVRHSLHVNQDGQRDKLTEVCRDLNDLIANIGGVTQA